MTYKIGAHNFNVLRVDKLNDIELSQKKNSEAKGAVDFKKNIIAIVDDLAKTRKQYVLLHQILYVLEYEAGIGLSERQIKAIGGCLYSQFNSEFSQLLKEILDKSEQFNGTYILED